MTVAAARDCEELLELFGRQCTAYETLLRLSKAQPRVFEAGGVPALMRLISKKHEIICQLRVTDRALEPYNITNNEFVMPWGFQDTGFSVNGGVVVNF